MPALLLIDTLLLCRLAQIASVLFFEIHGRSTAAGPRLQALALVSCYSDEWPLLVVVPASCRLQWAEEIERWLPHLRPSQLHVIEGQAGRVSTAAKPLVTITSFEMLQRLTCEACKGRCGQSAGIGSKSGPGGPAARYAASLAKSCPRQSCNDPQNCMAGMGWRVIIVDGKGRKASWHSCLKHVRCCPSCLTACQNHGLALPTTICTESHVLRTSSYAPDALHTEAVVATAKRASHAIFLSGTPSLSRPFDLYRQVGWRRCGLYGNRREEPRQGKSYK